MIKMHTKLYLLVVPCSLANIIWHIILQLLPRTTSTLRPVLGLKFKRISHKYPYTSNVWANAGYFPVIKEKSKKSMRGNSKWDINVQLALILSEVQGSAVAHYSSLTGRFITQDNYVLCCSYFLPFPFPFILEENIPATIIWIPYMNSKRICVKSHITRQTYLFIASICTMNKISIPCTVVHKLLTSK